MSDWYNDNDREVFGRDKIGEFIRCANPYYVIKEILKQYGPKNMRLILKESLSDLRDISINELK